MSSYYQNLIQTVLNHSDSPVWATAVLEWEVEDCEEDDSLESSCICGKENLKYLFTIRNKKNNNALYPIGSTCIKKFDRTDLNDVVSIQEGLFRLLHAISNKKFIKLTSEYFSRKILKYLCINNAFKPSKYNDFNAENDYTFLLKMFNKKDKNSISYKQQKKINAIIITNIRPYLESILRDKIKYKNEV